MATRIHIISLQLSLLLIASSLTSGLQAQGPLGMNYASINYSTTRPSSPVLQARGNNTHTFALFGNIVVTDSFDINLNASTGWFDQEFPTSGGSATVETELTSLTLRGVKHFLPRNRVNPFIAVGVGHRIREIEIENTTAPSQRDSTSGVEWNAGVEFIHNEKTILRPQVANGASFENFEADEFFFDNAAFDIQLIKMINNETFWGLRLGSDFDNIDYAAGVFFGFGAW